MNAKQFIVEPVKHLIRSNFRKQCRPEIEIGLSYLEMLVYRWRMRGVYA
jgi:hypothetical protein